MALDIIKVDGKYRVIKQGEEKTFGTHDTRREAEAQMRAINYSEGSHNANPTPGVQAGKGQRLNDSYEPVPISEVYVGGRKITTGQ